MPDPKHIEAVAEELWKAIGYDTMDGDEWPYERAVREADVKPLGRLPMARYVNSVREFARRAITAYEAAKLDDDNG